MGDPEYRLGCGPAGINEVYAVLEVENLKPDDVIVGVWYRGTERFWEQKLPAADIFRTAKRKVTWIAIHSDAGITPGSYRLELSLNGLVVRMGSFEVRAKPWWKLW